MNKLLVFFAALALTVLVALVGITGAAALGQVNAAVVKALQLVPR